MENTKAPQGAELTLLSLWSEQRVQKKPSLHKVPAFPFRTQIHYCCHCKKGYLETVQQFHITLCSTCHYVQLQIHVSCSWHWHGPWSSSEWNRVQWHMLKKVLPSSYIPITAKLTALWMVHACRTDKSSTFHCLSPLFPRQCVQRVYQST